MAVPCRLAIASRHCPRRAGGFKVGQASSLSPASTPGRAVPFNGNFPPGLGIRSFGSAVRQARGGLIGTSIFDALAFQCEKGSNYSLDSNRQLSLALLSLIWPRSLETWVQRPRCHLEARTCLKIQRGPAARVLVLVPQRGIGSARAARCGDAPAAPPWLFGPIPGVAADDPTISGGWRIQASRCDAGDWVGRVPWTEVHGYLREVAPRLPGKREGKVFLDLRSQGSLRSKMV